MSLESGRPKRKGHLGLIVSASLFGGLILALVLTLLVFGGGTEPVISGVALLAFALGWDAARVALRSSDRSASTVGIRPGDLHGRPRPSPLGLPTK